MKVYIVEFGEYSDRYVAGVFSTEEKAEQYIKDCIAHKIAYAMDANHNAFELDSGTIEWWDKWDPNKPNQETHREITKLY